MSASGPGCKPPGCGPGWVWTPHVDFVARQIWCSAAASPAARRSRQFRHPPVDRLARRLLRVVGAPAAAATVYFDKVSHTAAVKAREQDHTDGPVTSKRSPRAHVHGAVIIGHLGTPRLLPGTCQKRQLQGRGAPGVLSSELPWGDRSVPGALLRRGRSHCRHESVAQAHVPAKTRARGGTTLLW